MSILEPCEPLMLEVGVNGDQARPFMSPTPREPRLDPVSLKSYFSSPDSTANEGNATSPELGARCPAPSGPGPLPAERAEAVGEGASVAEDAPVTVLSDEEFKVALTQVIPQLRAFGRSLSGNRDLADDLVQETLMKAWAARARFQAGTNMRAWTFIILRNFYLSQMRRSRFHGDWDDLVADRILAAPSSQDKHVELGDLQRALLQLPTSQREALVLVGAGGFAYEEAAEICGVAVGTIKSRVARGRVALEALMNGGLMSSRRGYTQPDGETAFEVIMSQVNRLSAPR